MTRITILALVVSNIYAVKVERDQLFMIKKLQADLSFYQDRYSFLKDFITEKGIK